MRRQIPTIQDVARLAGVSAATVSRALSNPRIVSPKAREAVDEAVRATGYRVHEAARNLRMRRTGLIAVLVPNLGNPFFSRIIAGIESVASPLGYGVAVLDTGTPEQGSTSPSRDLADHHAAFLSGGRSDGLIVMDGSLRLPDGDWQTPVVFACEWPAEAAGVCVISVDNAAGARMAVEHLHALGHRRIGHVRGPAGNMLASAREAGYRAALARLGLPLDEAWLLPGDFLLTSGETAASLWLALDERPTALFCASDQMAYGLIASLHRQGIEVPRDLSICGFDDIDTAPYYVPPLTTIRQPRFEIGAAAARALLDGQRAPITLPLTLEVRGSAAPPPADGPARV